MTKPKPCRYERTLGYRATKGQHADDCSNPTGHRGCLPCEHPHCGVCGRKHLEDQHPHTCPDCVGSVREDLSEIAELCRSLRRQAAYASDNGRPWAAAPIPGATAMVLMGPQVDPATMRISNRLAATEYTKIHRPHDPLPPLTVLARWEDTWAAWLGQTRTGRASVTRAVAYLDQHLTRIAQARTRWVDDVLVTAPEFAEFATDIGKMRAQLEHVLHDESEDDEGIACFECGHQLVRRIRDPKRCRHKTPARQHLAARLRDRVDPAAWLAVLRSYGLPAWPEEIDAARLPTPVEVAAARLPCDRCDQGGVADPRPGVSWECPSCRMTYSPGEYAHAVRRDLADRQYVAQGAAVEVPSLQSYGWTDITLAADAASTLVGYPVFATTVRKWAQREKVAWCCVWSCDRVGSVLVSRPSGQRLVFWPDVAEEAANAVERARRAAEARARRAEREAAERAEEQQRAVC